MSAILLDGKSVAKKINSQIKRRLASLYRKYPGRKACLCVVSVGNCSSAGAYSLSQKRLAESLGIAYKSVNFDADTTIDQLKKSIHELNHNKRVTGILINQPLPKKISFENLIQGLSPLKDVEGLHPLNMGKLFYADTAVYPCTPAAVMRLLKEYDVDLYGKNVAIIGHSYVVGRPLSLLFLEKMATTAVCHIATHKTGNLPSYIKKADILVVAVGCPNLIKGSIVKKDVVVVDVGINVVDRKIVGDVEFKTVSKKASYITPVPGGVGPVTVSMLMKNLVELYNLQQKHET